MRSSLIDLEGKQFDVAVIGAGLIGANAAQHLTAAGFTVLIVDKEDFCYGASSRSGRVLHCGLRYLGAEKSIWEFVRNPNKLFVGMRMARHAMMDRADFVSNTPERFRSESVCFPVYAGGYAPWQVKLAFRMLQALGPSRVPLGYRWHESSEIKNIPIAKWLRDQDKIRGLAMFTEYNWNWPERVCVDILLDAERMGASIRNYTQVCGLKRTGDQWQLELRDTLIPRSRVHVQASKVLNLAGPWIDEVNSMTGTRARRLIKATKGVHIAVRLPPECKGYTLYTFNREKEGLTIHPLGDLHQIGPTETLFEGNPDDARPLDSEIDWLIEETNYLLPSWRLKRDHVLFAWAGVRPLGADPRYPKGKRSREIHDLAKDGMPGVYAMTAGPIMTSRSAGKELTGLIASKLKPSRPPQEPSYKARSFPETPDSPLLLEDYPAIKLSDLSAAARGEHVTSLVDLLCRRVDAGWTASMGYEAAANAAQEVAPVLGWDRSQVDAEVSRYQEYLKREYCFTPGVTHPPVQPWS